MSKRHQYFTDDSPPPPLPKRRKLVEIVVSPRAGPSREIEASDRGVHAIGRDSANLTIRSPQKLEPMDIVVFKTPRRDNRRRIEARSSLPPRLRKTPPKPVELVATPSGVVLLPRRACTSVRGVRSIVRGIEGLTLDEQHIENIYISRTASRWLLQRFFLNWQRVFDFLRCFTSIVSSTTWHSVI